MEQPNRDDLTFLGLSFTPVRLEDKGVLQDYLRRFPQKVSGYTFATLAAWSAPYGMHWSRINNGCVILCRQAGPQGELQLQQPIGVMKPDCWMPLLQEARKLHYPLEVLYVAQAFLDNHTEFCSHFTAEADRTASNYIYLARDLADLEGGRYAKKRNLISQFLELYKDWEAVPLDFRCGQECREVLLAIAHDQGLTTDDPTLKAELGALDFSMRHFDELEQCGMMIRVNGVSVAFSMFERLNGETAVIHFEKARREFKGLYQMINRETSRMIVAAGYRLINREEDLGKDGLRQAKLSYNPVEIYPVYNLTLNTGVV